MAMKSGIFTILTLIVSVSARAEEIGPVPGCFWQPGMEKIGTVCGNAMEYSGPIISCEGSSQLYFSVEQDCGGAEECAVALEIDGKVIDLGMGKYVEDAYSGTSVPLSHRKDLLALLKSARRLRTIVAGKTSINLPVKGLPEAVDALVAACPEHAS